MSNPEFENYMALVSRLLRLTGDQEQMIRDELRDHLEFRVADLIETGTEPNEAVRKALAEFGDAASLAQQFQSIFKSNQKRWIMRFATFSIAGTFVAAVLIMAMWPSPARFGAPAGAVAVQDDQPFDDNGIESDPFGNTQPPSANRPSQSANALIAKSTTAAARKVKPRRLMNSEDIDQILKKPVDFEYYEDEFALVMDELRSTHHFNVILDHSAQDDSLTEETLISFQIKNVRLSTALRLMLIQQNATYVIDDGVMRFISLDDASDPHFHRRRVFDCRKLLTHIENTDPRVGDPLTPAEGGGRGGGGGGGGGGGAQGGGVFCVVPQTTGIESLLGNPNNQDQPRSGGDLLQPAQGLLGGLLQEDSTPRVSASYLLVNLLKSSVAAEDWDDTNGDGTMSMIGGLMVVNQTEQALHQIESLLSELEQKMK